MRYSVRCGLDNLKLVHDALAGRRLGLMTNPTGITHDFASTIDILHGQYHLTALFACEHGVRGNLQAGERLADGVDEETGIPVYSCYGDTRRLTPAMVDTFDVFVFDMQDVGARFYTYLYSLAYAMEACAGAGKPVVVLDRLNPVNGLSVQGTVLNPAFHSFVGEYPLPTRYGLTIGEYALWAKAHLGLKLDLRIAPLAGWKRHFFLDDTDVPWVAPSPNCATFQAALIYSGTCIFEGTNLSEGRGTTLPFELIGAPWMDANKWAAALNGLGLPGVYFRRASFTPMFSKHAGRLCHGVQVHITDKNLANPFEAGLHMLEAARAQHPDCFEFLPSEEPGRLSIDLLLGTDALTTGGMAARELIAAQRPALEAFGREKQAFHLYG